MLINLVYLQSNFFNINITIILFAIVCFGICIYFISPLWLCVCGGYRTDSPSTILRYVCCFMMCCHCTFRNSTWRTTLSKQFDWIQLSSQAKYISTCIEEIKQELRQDNISVKCNAVAKLTYVSISIIIDSELASLRYHSRYLKKGRISNFYNYRNVIGIFWKTRRTNYFNFLL